ncbi:SseB family protein [Streptomyces mexicanus]|uniref:SseB family protein n=1 Tax=Streptomyces mexicanus TaxID=178566 RepID=A0A7X1I015_9ACTN|nr:SseB family protein [Streptomyces mexicanus]MBC2864073.1 SseB family protein [Streptomyces mexicanus]
MTNPGGGGQAPVRRSRITDYADLAGPARHTDIPPLSTAAAVSTTAAEQQEPAQPPSAERGETAGPSAAPKDSRATVDARRRRFTEVLSAFRDTAVLVPVEDHGWLTVDLGGVRWILAFSDEPSLARYALSQGRGHEEWTYERVLGARLLDVAVPVARVPCGVALDAADGGERAVLFPPVSGIVPDAYAVDKGYAGDTAVTGRGKEKR